MPNDVLRVRSVGFGFMGRMHYRCWKILDGVQVTAVCDVDPRALADAAKRRGNIAGAEGEVDLAGVQGYEDFEQMIGREPLDAVSITVPTYLLAPSTIAALDAGLHVLCDEPMAWTRRFVEYAAPRLETMTHFQFYERVRRLRDETASQPPFPGASTDASANR
jgi:predicted dehydrogenase